MKLSWTRWVVLGAAFVLVASPLAAQRRAGRPAARTAGTSPRLGPHFGYNIDFEAALLGAQLSFPIAPRFDLYPTFDVFFVDGGSLWALNLDGRYRPPTRFGLLYVGAGVQYLRGDGGSDTGLNILGGIEGRRSAMRPYVELRLSLGDEANFQFVGGLSFRL